MRLNIKVNPEDVEAKIITPLATWISKIDDTKKIIDEEQKQLKDLEKQYQKNIRNRNKELAKVGYEVSDKDYFDWLINGPALNLLKLG